MGAVLRGERPKHCEEGGAVNCVKPMTFEKLLASVPLHTNNSLSGNVGDGTSLDLHAMKFAFNLK